MSDQTKIFRFASFDRLVTRLRDDFQSGGNEFVLLYAYILSAFLSKHQFDLPILLNENTAAIQPTATISEQTS